MWNVLSSKKKWVWCWFWLFCLSGCAPEESDDLGPFEDGTGGTAVNAETVQEVTLSLNSGVAAGTFSYDSSYFTLIVDEETHATTIFDTPTATNPTPELAVVIFPIVGRVATTCRYQAAVQARDSHYTILEKEVGTRTNSNGLEFYQVNLDLKEEGKYQSMLCADLLDSTGAFFQVITENKAALEYEQLLFLLNSVNSI